jgi:ribonuclease VapC
MFLKEIAENECSMSTASFLESAIVADGSRDPILSRKFDQLLLSAGIRIEPVTEVQAYLARQAYRDFGKGSGHPAQLNFGDCFAYALAKNKDEPLLFKGLDFARTDVQVA